MKISIYITYFFHSIFTSSPSVTTEKNKVRFDDEKADIDLPQASSQGLSSTDLYKKMPSTFIHVIKFIKILCIKTDEKVNLCYLKILDEILASTLNTEFLQDIVKSYEESFDMSENKSLIFFNKIVLKWVSMENLDASSVACISDIVFSLCASVSEGEALEMLNSCCKVKNPIFLENILGKGLGKYIHEPVVQNWVKSPTLFECILHGFKDMMESLIEDENVNEESVTLAHKNILLMCLVNKEIQEFLNETRSIEHILIVCKEFIDKGVDCKNVHSIIEISCSVTEAILLNYKECWNYSITDHLLSVIFLQKINAKDYGLSDKACSAILQVWYFAIFSAHKNNVVTRKDGFLIKAAKELHSCICDLLTFKKATNILDEIVNLLHTVEEIQLSLPESYSSAYILSELLENILPSDLDWQKLRENLVLSPIPSTLKRKFMHYSHRENCVVPQPDAYKLLWATKAVSSFFVVECSKYKSCEDEQYFEQYILKYMPNLLWSLSYFDGDGYANKDSETEHAIHILNTHLETFLKFVSYEKLKGILKNIFYCSLSEGLYWALPFQLLIEKVENLYSDSITLFDDLISESSMMESDYVSLNVQILSHHVSKDKKIFYLKNLLGDLSEHGSNFNQETDDEYLSKLGEICCFIQDSDVIDEEIQSLLSEFFTVFPSYYECPKDSSLFYLEFISLMSSIVQYAPNLVTKNSWDFLQKFLSSSLKEFDKPDELIFLFQVSMAYSTSFSFICASEDREMLWTPSVSNAINDAFISFFIYMSGAFKKPYQLSQAFDLSLASLLKAVEYIPENVIFNYVMSSHVATSESDSKDGKVATPLDDLSSILLSDNPYLQLATHVMLIKIMPLLSESLSSAMKFECNDSDDEEEKLPSKLLPLVEMLIILNDLMEGMLWDIKIGECCLVIPETEPFAFVFAYLFAWLQMLEFISTSPAQVRSGYVAHLEETKLLSSLFSNVFRLMPENPVSCFKKESGSDSPKKENFVSLFLHTPQINAGEPSSKQIQIMACYVFCTAMRKVPASVRTWWNNLDKNSAEIVNKFTAKYISGILCSEEIQAVYSNENLFKNMVVKTRLGSREVIATYTVDDFAIELCVQLPANYPLDPITAEKRGKIVIPHQEWRHWLRQLTTVLNYQNGSLLDGLNIWKKNLDKKFEGIEECMICYYILHSSTMKLPQLSCNTCSKKFHSACLYKWFQSINNSKCPLCRNEFRI